MKNKLFISHIRKIKSSYKRFISLLCMALLGVGFFAGIKATSPDMLSTLDDYLKEQNVYDIEVVSTLGLTSEDVKAIQQLGIARQVEGSKEVDVALKIQGQEQIIKVQSIGEMNQVLLVEGKTPSNNQEIVVEEKLLSDHDLSIGDSVYIESDCLDNHTYKIVGVVQSPLYFSTSRGTTSIGSGKLNYYTYVLESAFNTDYYSEIYISLNDTQDLVTNSDKYSEVVDAGIKKIESIQSEAENRRFNELYQEQINYMESMGVSVDTSMLETPTWYLFDRNDNQGYTTYIDATVSLEKLGSIFPLVFYIVAILISLISMMRMVDEERLEIGTLKGLGFSNWQIMKCYILYSFLATLLGGVLGCMIGFQLIPRVIWDIYQALFTIPTFQCQFNFYYAFVGIISAFVCICGAAIVSATLTLKEKSSELMRPKAPKVGKKILLERIPWFWKRVKFSNKVTIRNIFRYKKRILVTIIGIAGSTSLILVGFGLKDSVSNVVEYNYSHVFIYDEIISLKENSDATRLGRILDSNSKIEAKVEARSEVIKIKNKEESLDVNLIVPENKEELKEVIQLNNIHNNYELIDIQDNELAISEKLARELQVEEGDIIQVWVQNEYVEVQVNYIVENYVYDYAYMTKNTYESIFGTFSKNMIFIRNSEDYDSDYDEVILEEDCVSALVSVEVTSALINDVLSSLNSVVIVLIVASAILAFVILYNLSNINISERKREISTLKVLGFYDEEVDAYIIKENYFITIIGIAIGLVIGLYLSHYIISTCEPEYVMFIRHIEIFSYVMAAVISIAFTFIVNKITHFNLKKIDMVESLKSGE